MLPKAPNNEDPDMFPHYILNAIPRDLPGMVQLLFVPARRPPQWVRREWPVRQRTGLRACMFLMCTEYSTMLYSCQGTWQGRRGSASAACHVTGIRRREYIEAGEMERDEKCHHWFLAWPRLADDMSIYPACGGPSPGDERVIEGDTSDQLYWPLAPRPTKLPR